MLNDLLTSYKQLCDYCDNFFDSILHIYAPYMKCKRGCYACCNLESVSALEAHVIQQYLAVKNDRPLLNQEEGCVLLNNGECSIYLVRPIICRTHGLLVLDTEREFISNTCELNFKNVDLEKWDRSHILNISRITENLIRLNILFLHSRCDDIENDTRVLLSKLIS